MYRTMVSPSPVRVLSRRTVKPPPRPREHIQLTTWDLSMLDGDYIKKGLLFPPPPISTSHLVDHLDASLADALAVYYPVAGRLSTHRHRRCDAIGDVVGCSVSIDCAGQGAEILHAIADDVTLADVIRPNADVPRVVRSFFPLDAAANYDGHELPLLAVQVTELVDGVFVGFAYNHALSDGTSCWNFLNAWAEIARLKLSPPGAKATRVLKLKPPLIQRWSPDHGDAAAPIVLPYTDLAALVQRQLAPDDLREKMLHFSSESLTTLKEQARRELTDAGDEEAAMAVTKFQALGSLLWRCVTRARHRHEMTTTTTTTKTVCASFAINNRNRLRPPIPAEYFGNCVDLLTTEAVSASKLLARGHGWAAGAVGRAVAAHTDMAVRARAAAWEDAKKPMVSMLRPAAGGGGGNDVFVMLSSPRFDVYGCDFGWGKPVAVRSGVGNKFDGVVGLFPGREGGGSIEVEVALAPEHMAALEQDDELWAAVSPGARGS
ncbi:hypothetical protein HU200_016572 [Digitaria exilis]|uniref:Acetyltransferase n=1 Tax=Digitaria exilis TaxID=1010633 RepID=A0A835F840_9POAL|nr:hypothetical protein HU200_016572 [Digitaria exilis]CAB3491353.1 unnamed protein product [Digitaria exilis]